MRTTTRLHYVSQTTGVSRRGVRKMGPKAPGCKMLCKTAAANRQHRSQRWLLDPRPVAHPGASAASQGVRGARHGVPPPAGRGTSLESGSHVRHRCLISDPYHSSLFQVYHIATIMPLVIRLAQKHLLRAAKAGALDDRAWVLSVSSAYVSTLRPAVLCPCVLQTGNQLTHKQAVNFKP